MGSFCLFRDRKTFTHVKHKRDSRRTHMLTRNTCTIVFFGGGGGVLTRAVSLTYCWTIQPHLENLKSIFSFCYFLCGVKIRLVKGREFENKKKNDDLLPLVCLYTGV